LAVKRGVLEIGLERSAFGLGIQAVFGNFLVFLGIFEVFWF
jgi:hypothetical protein